MFCVWFLRLLPLARRVPSSSFFRFLSLFFRARLVFFVHSSTDRTVRSSILRGRFRSVSHHHHVIHPPRTPRLFPWSFLRLVRLFVPRRRVETNGAFVVVNRPPPMRPSPELRTHTLPPHPSCTPFRTSKEGGDEGGRTPLVPALRGQVCLQKGCIWMGGVEGGNDRPTNGGWRENGWNTHTAVSHLVRMESPGREGNRRRTNPKKDETRRRGWKEPPMRYVGRHP